MRQNRALQKKTLARKTAGLDAAWQAFQPETVAPHSSTFSENNPLAAHIPWLLEVDMNGQLLMSEGHDFLARTSPVGSNFFNLWGCENTATHLRKVIFQAMNQERSFQALPVTYSGQNGATQTYEVQGSPIYQNGDVVAVQCLVHNTTRTTQAQSQAAYFAQHEPHTGLLRTESLAKHLKALCIPINQLPWQAVYLKLPTLSHILQQHDLPTAQAAQAEVVEALKDQCTARDKLTYSAFGQFGWLLVGCTEAQAQARLAAVRQAIGVPLSHDFLTTKGASSQKVLAQLLG